MNLKEKTNQNIIWIYGIADFHDNKITVLKEAVDNSEIIEDSSVKNPINFDQIINGLNKNYISYITISGVRRYSLIEKNDNLNPTIKFLPKNEYMWNIFKIYKYHYIDNYINPNPEINNKKVYLLLLKL